MSHPETEQSLTPEQTERIDHDLATISLLSEIAVRNGGVFELQGGYATDALLGGGFRRPHGDIDGLIWYGSDSDSVEKDVNAMLEREATVWEETDRKPGHVEMTEDDNTKNPDLRRRLDLYMFSRITKRPLITKTISNSHGIKFEVNVLPLSEFVARKIKVLVQRHRQGEEARRAGNFRDTRDSDRADLIALMASADFDKEECMHELGRGPLPTSPSSPHVAEDRWTTATELLHSQQGSL